MLNNKIILEAAISGKNDIMQRIEESILEIAKIEEEIRFFRQKLYEYDLVIKNLEDKNDD